MSPQPFQNPTEQTTYFALMADLDHTKHIGGLSATEELAALCGLTPGDHVLDVGCGVGVTPVILAREYGCRVVGVDYMPPLIDRAVARAQREGVAAQTTFSVGDAQSLPHADGVFDAALAESVITFVPDPQRAVGEMARVVRPGGHVAITEAIWIQPPPPNMVDFMTHAAGLPRGVRMHDQWRATFERAGLHHITAHQYAISGRSEARDQFRRLGCRGYLRTFLRSMRIFTKPEYRQLMGSALRQPVLSYFDYLGYGVYAGRKD